MAKGATLVKNTKEKRGHHPGGPITAVSFGLILDSVSEIEALKVGAAIEEIDILDLQKYIAETDNEDIIVVYENLMKGSRNHLRAFVKRLTSSGVTYEPQYLSIEDYQDIIDSDVERGRGR